jgi:NADPH-dependent 2,4-dienoyl-CoA reductase/sulfur reductase-like enzyme
MRRDPDAEWRLGVRATGLDPLAKRVLLEDGESLPYDRVLIATGTRARPWPNPQEAALEGVFTLRTREEGAGLAERLDAGPERVLVIGAGFTGSEIASACRERGLNVTVAERGPAPLVGALGGTLSKLAAVMQRNHGVDLRTGVTVTALHGNGGFTGAELSDGSRVDADVCVVALGAVRNVEWLAESGLAAGPRGIACDAGCRAFTMYGIVTDDVFVAGDVARSPHAVFGYQFLSLEHWGNAVAQAETAAHNMVCHGADRRPHLWMPAFWSSMFGVNIKSVGVPPMGDQLMITQGSLAERRFVGVYGYQGRIIAAVSFDHTRWLEFYARQIERGAPFPVEHPTMDRRPEGRQPVAADFPDPSLPTHGPTVTLTGYSPADQQLVFHPARH